MKHNCKRCGKPLAVHFDYCFKCGQLIHEREAYRSWLEKSEEEKETEREIYYSHECSMCGKEGADERSDGSYFCGSCWTIWNS